jgi:hypothetical protein
MSENLVKDMAEDSVNYSKVSWYSYIRGGDLGGVNVRVAWDQHLQRATVLASPTVTFGTLTKVFEYRYTYDGQTYTGQCQQPKSDGPPIEVPVVTLPVAYGNDTSADVPKDDFTIITVWGLPFEASGIQFHEEPGVVSVLKAETGDLAKGFFSYYDKLTPAQQFAAETALGLLTGEAYVQAVEKTTVTLARFARGFEDLEHLAGLSAKYLHGYKAVTDFVGALAGFSGEYPVMAAVVRGSFHTEYHKTRPQDGSKPQLTPYITELAVSVKSTQFPDISLKISRDAEELTAGNKVYEGVLPWKSNPFGTQSKPITYNPFSYNPAYLIAPDTRTNNHYYQSGKTALDNIIADTSQTPVVAKSMVKYKNLAENFTAEQAEGSVPVCDDNGTVKSLSDTFCWVFNDGKA